VASKVSAMNASNRASALITIGQIAGLRAPVCSWASDHGRVRGQRVPAGPSPALL
jgi:hypothetical protein